MSMQELNILQLLQIAFAYFGVTLVLPALVLSKKLEKEHFGVRFLIYLISGNFVIINLVLVLELAHISNWFTLTAGTLFITAFSAVKINHLPVGEMLFATVEMIKRLLNGSLGLKLFLEKIVQGPARRLKRGGQRLLRGARKDWPDWLATFGVLLWAFIILGTNYQNNYGYCASDIPVHNYWINELSENNPFAAGVYPLGFHCVIYYLRTVFGIPTYVLLRMFCVIQMLLVHLAMLIFLKRVCKTRFMPYLGIALYTGTSFWNPGTYTRFLSSLPQEFGMIYILPSILFLVLFFEERKKENKAKGIKLHSTCYLMCFAMAFAMTLAIHFYNTMIAGLLCLGIAVGYLGRLFRKAYFGRILATGIISVMVAVLPMGIAYATGTPLEGSLRWGMSIMEGSNHKTAQEYEEERLEQEKEAQANGTSQADGTSREDNAEAVRDTQTDSGSENTTNQKEPSAFDGLMEKIRVKTERLKDFVPTLRYIIQMFMMSSMSYEFVGFFMILSILPLLLGLIFVIPKSTRECGCTNIAVAVGTLFLDVLMMAGWLGLPPLMDQSRCSIYLVYLMSTDIVLGLDALWHLCLRWFSRDAVQHWTSLGFVIVCVLCIFASGYYRTPVKSYALETNGAITCLTNILRDNKDLDFTICSANDELRMVQEYGFHYEIIDFLRQMEGGKMDGRLTLPTSKVYFFIEKIPIAYTVYYDGIGQSVSEEGAAEELPKGSGLGIYQGKNRFIVMSRMYYWAQEFQKLYPTEMRVYYETEDFICYVVEQNPYRLFDFSINYGFNDR